MEQLLEPDFVPRKKDRKAFKIDDRSFYLILFKNVLCDAGKEIVRCEKNKGKGQAAWSDLVDHYLGAGSIPAELANDKLHDELTETVKDILM